MRLRMRAILFLGWVASIGCSLVVETGGLSGGADSQISSDGGGATEAGSGTDGTAPTDGGSMETSGSFCATTDAALCDDFDNGAIGAGWTRVVRARGTTTVEPVAKSAPFALRVAADPAGGVGIAALHWAASSTRVVCDLDVMMLAAPSGGEWELAAIEVSVPWASMYGVYVGRAGGSWLMAEIADLTDGGSLFRTQSIPSLPTNGWAHMQLGIQGSTATITVDGTNAQLQLATMPAVAPTTIILGIPYANTNASVAMRIDNVACSVQN